MMSAKETPMSWPEILFSFEGRLNRARYWRAVLAVLAAMAVTVFIIEVLVPQFGLGVQYIIRALLALFIGLPFTIAGFAISVKRLHDHNFNGWWVIALLVLSAASAVA